MSDSSSRRDALPNFVNLYALFQHFRPEKSTNFILFRLTGDLFCKQMTRSFYRKLVCGRVLAVRPLPPNPCHRLGRGLGSLTESAKLEFAWLCSAMRYGGGGVSSASIVLGSCCGQLPFCTTL